MLKITEAKQILEIIAPIPAEKFGIDKYRDEKGLSCVLGHIHLSVDKKNKYGDLGGFGARELSKKFLKEKHYLKASIVDVNNDNKTNGYKEPVIKDRVMHLIKDMIAAGY